MRAGRKGEVNRATGSTSWFWGEVIRVTPSEAASPEEQRAELHSGRRQGSRAARAMGAPVVEPLDGGRSVQAVRKVQRFRTR
jgi:hypothetical protein